MTSGEQTQFGRAGRAPGDVAPGGSPFGRDVRCEACGALLARIDARGLCIRRGDLTACIDGRFQARLTCYRPRCKRLNRLQVTTET